MQLQIIISRMMYNPFMLDNADGFIVTAYKNGKEDNVSICCPKHTS